MTIGIIVAMEKEMAQLRKILSHPQVEQYQGREYALGQIDDKEVIIQQCGIGKVNAAIGAVEMIGRYHPDIIISSGCAGGADTRLKVTDVVVGTTYTYHAPMWPTVSLSACRQSSKPTHSWCRRH